MTNARPRGLRIWYITFCDAVRYSMWHSRLDNFTFCMLTLCAATKCSVTFTLCPATLCSNTIEGLILNFNFHLRHLCYINSIQLQIKLNIGTQKGDTHLLYPLFWLPQQFQITLDLYSTWKYSTVRLPSQFWRSFSKGWPVKIVYRPSNNVVR